MKRSSGLDFEWSCSCGWALKIRNGKEPETLAFFVRFVDSHKATHDAVREAL